MFGYNSPRYGAWSIDPYGAPTVAGIAMNTATGIGNIQNQFEKNRQLQQQIDFARQTMPGLIASTNATNSANTQFAIPDASAKYQGLLANNALIGAKTQDTLSDLPLNQARVGLLNAQKNYQNAQTDVTEGVQDPSQSFFRLKATYDSLPDGSAEKQYTGALLNRMMNMSAGGYLGQSSTNQPASNAASSPNYTNSNGIITPKAAGTVGGGGSIINSVNGQPYNVNAGSISQRSLKGSQYAQPNPQDPNSTTTYESPTATAEGKEQIRGMAHGELDALGKVYIAGVTPYMGTQGLLNLAKDKALAAFGDSDAITRLAAYTQSQNIKPELAATIGRFSTGAEPGIETIKRFEDGPLSTHWLTPQESASNALQSYLKTQTDAFNQSVLPERTGFAMNVPGQPNWLGQQNAPAPINLFTGNSKQDAVNLAQLNNPKPVAPSNNQQSSPKGLSIPEFKSQADFNNWYFSQPVSVRAAIRKQMGG